MMIRDESVEDESPGNEGTGSQISSYSSSALILEINGLMDEENRKHDYILGNWIVAPSRCLVDFKPARHGGLPLILCSRSVECSNQVILDVFNGRHYHHQETNHHHLETNHHHQEMITVTNITDFLDKKLVYSKDGWLLFSRPISTSDFGQTLFLHNIVTGECIDLPDNGGPKLSGEYVFSTSSSSSSAPSVDYVVHVNRDSSTRQTTLHMICPDAGSWEVYTKELEPKLCSKFNIPCFHKFVGVIIVGKKAYMFYDSERVDVFDLVEKRWLSVSGLQMQMPYFYVAELDGKIVRIYAPRQNLNLYRFFRLEWDDEEYSSSWVEMSETELENKSWFLGFHGSDAFCVKGCQGSGGEAAVYRFTYHLVSKPESRRKPRSRRGRAINIHTYDLKAGIARKVLPFPVFSSAVNGWVDLGYFSDSRV